MRNSLVFSIDDPCNFKFKLFAWASRQQKVLFLDSHTEHGYQHKLSYRNFDCIVATGSIRSIQTNSGNAFGKIKRFHSDTNDWLFGHFSYDLKNEIEQLISKNPDKFHIPDLHFFQPELIFILDAKQLNILYFESVISSKKITSVFDEISHIIPDPNPETDKISFKESFSKEEYLNTVRQILSHIQRGDIYEMNFCQEFYAENTRINPAGLYEKFQQVSPTPFSAYYHFDDYYCLSASPERFLTKRGKKLISQPIKGTIRRGLSDSEDQNLIEKLKSDPKERAENIMIVDLVRNDLSRTAARGTVKVDELCGIYTFPQVHQMISTISSNLDSRHHFIDALKFAFPMGSMTGAPKIRAMQLIEKFERSKRGLYSGSIGYIDPTNNFDFNVVIRSIFYNSAVNNISYFVGGAITNQSVPEMEYEECLLKAEAMLKTFR